MTGFVRLKDDGRLMYWFARVNAGPSGWLLKGHVSGSPFPIAVVEAKTEPMQAEGLPRPQLVEAKP